MDALGRRLRLGDPATWAAWMPGGASRLLFLTGRPHDGGPASSGNGQMARFLARERPIAERCHALALPADGTTEGSPGLRPHYRQDDYGAYFRDSSGNNRGRICRREPARYAANCRSSPLTQ
ncbi:VOC family protein [Burkholderia singularis]|nr:VOC family protein [Burkholderia singularis]